MNNNSRYSEIAFILDRSGSMGDCCEAAIEGFNRFLLDQQKGEGRARLTLVLFDDEYLIPVRSIPVEEVVPLNTDTYVPRNSTALLDAIGQTIDDLGARLAAMNEADRPSKVIVPILTDGLENASRRYRWPEVAAKIRHQSEVYNWSFLFLGSNQDAIATAAQLHIGAGNAATFVADEAGSLASFGAISRRTHGYRQACYGRLNAEAARVLETPLSAILQEEEARERSTAEAS